MSTTPTPEEVVRNTRFVRSPDFRTIYANWIQGAYGPFEVSLLVGESFAAPNQTIPEVEQMARVVLSPIEAKLLVMILIGVVKNFEIQYGEIKIPPGLDAMFSTGGPNKDDSEGD